MQGAPALKSSKLIISSFQDINVLLKEGIDEADISRIRFDGWPKLAIKVEGKNYHGSITPWSAQGLYDIYQSIRKAYSVCKTGSHDLRSTKGSVSKKYFCDFSFQINEGCTEIITDFLEKIPQLLIDLVKDGFKTMTPTQKFIFLCLSACCFAGYMTYSRYLESADTQANFDFQASQSKEQIEGHTKIQEEDRKIIETMFSHLPDVPRDRISAAQDEIEKGHHDFIRKTSDANSISIGEQYFDKDAINRVVEAEEQTLNYEHVKEDIVVIEGIKKRVNGTKGRVSGISQNFHDKSITLEFMLGSVDESIIYGAAKNNKTTAIKVSYIAACNDNGEFVNGQITKVDSIVEK